MSDDKRLRVFADMDGRIKACASIARAAVSDATVSAHIEEILCSESEAIDEVFEALGRACAAARAQLERVRSTGRPAPRGLTASNDETKTETTREPTP